MNKQGIIIGACLVFFSNLFIRAFGLNEEIGQFKPKLWIALFIYIFGILLYFSMLRIEFDPDKLTQKKKYAILSAGTAFIALIMYYLITERWSIRTKVEMILGNKGKRINERIIMTGIFLLGVFSIYLYDLAKKEVNEIVQDI
jgi:hypothetical protein